MSCGLLVIDKPEGWTSHDVVARVRRILKTKRVGHTGTLDPFATGVIVLLVGKATRLAQFLDKDEKEYEAVIRFGYETDTGDRTGKPKTQDAEPKPVDMAQLENILPEFIGEIEQVPPMYSAKKVEGRKLYELARRGITIKREAVKVSIRHLEIVESNEIENRKSEVRVRVVCSAGTYVRTLAEDIGRRIGVGAHLVQLRRVRAGRFDLNRSVKISELEATNESSSLLISIEEAVSHLPALALSAERVESTRNGLPTRATGDEFAGQSGIRMTDENGNLLAVGFYDADESAVRPRILLV